MRTPTAVPVELDSAAFVEFIERLTGIDGLIAGNR